jgi:hypothetical protein
MRRKNLFKVLDLPQSLAYILKELAGLRVQEGFTIKKLADHFGVGTTTIFKELRKSAGPARARHWYGGKSSDFRKWFSQSGQFADSLLFLFDYQIDADANGISLINEFGIEREAILITSAYNDECFISSLRNSRMNCVKVLPKVLIEQVAVKNLFIKTQANVNEYNSVPI